MAGPPLTLLPLPHLGVQREATHSSSLMIAQAAGSRWGRAEAPGQWLQPGPVYHLPPPKMWELFQVHRGALMAPFPGLQTPPKQDCRAPGDKALTCFSCSQGPRPPWLERCGPPWFSEGQRNLAPLPPTPVPSCTVGVCPMLAREGAGWLRDSRSIPGRGEAELGVSDDGWWGEASLGAYSLLGPVLSAFHGSVSFIPQSHSH